MKCRICDKEIKTKTYAKNVFGDVMCWKCARVWNRFWNEPDLDKAREILRADKRTRV